MNLPNTMPVWEDTASGRTQTLLYDWHWLGFMIPHGFQTDGTSSPWWARWYIPKRDPTVFASYLHDYALTIMPRYEAALVYRTALEALNTSTMKKQLLYLGVRINDFKHFIYNTTNKTMKTILNKLKSRKLAVTVATTLITVFSEQLNLSPELVSKVVSVVTVYILGQSAVDITSTVKGDK